MNWPWYFILDSGLWCLTILVIRWAWPHLGRCWRISACSTALLVMLLQSFNEVLSRQVFNAWDFSFEHNRMLGIHLFGEPVEEYLFWWVFAWFIPFLYSGFVYWFGQLEKQKGLTPTVNTDE